MADSGEGDLDVCASPRPTCQRLLDTHIHTHAHAHARTPHCCASNRRAALHSTCNPRRSPPQVLARIREQGGAFEHQSASSTKADKVNDGNNYKGLMHLGDYKRKREEVLEDKEEKKREAVAEAVSADREARAKAAREREEREAQRRERLKAQLSEVAQGEGEASSEAATAADGEDEAAAKIKKKKKKKAPSEVLSFDVDDG